MALGRDNIISIDYRNNIYEILLDRIACYINAGGYNLHDEIDDTITQRYGYTIQFPVSKLTMNQLISGNAVNQFPAQPPTATVMYIICPRGYSKVPDTTVYDFRDDFMDASIDVDKWNIQRIGAGYIEIDAQHQWMKFIGGGGWNQGIYSKTSITREVGKTYMVDVFVDFNTSGMPQACFGFVDGGGYNYTNFVHGLNFGVTEFNILENGNQYNTGVSYHEGSSYRIKIVLKTTGATYLIQGGQNFPSIGSSDWEDLTPVESVATTSTLYAGLFTFDKNMWASDVKIY